MASSQPAKFIVPSASARNRCGSGCFWCSHRASFMSIFAPNVEPPLAPVQSLRENSCEPCQLCLRVATVFLQSTRLGGAGRMGSNNCVSVKPKGTSFKPMKTSDRISLEKEPSVGNSPVILPQREIRSKAGAPVCQIDWPKESSFPRIPVSVCHLPNHQLRLHVECDVRVGNHRNCHLRRFEIGC